MIWYDMIYDIWYMIYDMTWHDMTWHDMTWHDMTWQDMTWHDMTWHDMTWHDMTWHDMTWHDMIWYDTIRYDTTRYGTVRYGMVRCACMMVGYIIIGSLILYHILPHWWTYPEYYNNVAYFVIHNQYLSIAFRRLITWQYPGLVYQLFWGTDIKHVFLGPHTTRTPVAPFTNKD